MKHSLLMILLLIFLTQVVAQTPISDAKRYWNLHGVPKFVQETECHIYNAIIADNAEATDCDTVSESLFNPSGNRIQLTETNQINGELLVNKTIATYKDEQLISYRYYDKSQQLTKIGVLSYPDTMTRIITNKNASGEFVGKDILTYDKNGDWISYTAYNADDKVFFKAIFSYNDKHQQIMVKKYKGFENKLLEEKHYLYNDKGFVSVEIEKKPKQIKRTYQYISYDDKGNWLRKVSYEGNKAKKMWYRTISYYK